MAKKTLSEEEQIELDQLKARATELEIPFKSNVAIANLKDKIAAKEAELDEAAGLGYEIVDPQKPGIVEDESEATATVPEEKMRKCHGLFVSRPASDFTQNDRYCDEYLKSKGLLKED